MTDELNPKHGVTVAIPFKVVDAVTNQTNTDLTIGGGSGTVAVMPKAGSVVGLTVGASAAFTAGSASFRVHSSGTEFAQSGYPNPSLSSAAQVSYATIRPRAITFAAGASIGVSYTSSTTMDPTNSNDFDALLFVVFQED